MWIQRDWNEQLKHRAKDSEKLIQRNWNILVDLLSKQNTEAKRTVQYGHYVITRKTDSPTQYYWAKIHYPPYLKKFKHCHAYKGHKR